MKGRLVHLMKQGAVLKSTKEKKRTRFDLESPPEVFGAPDPERKLQMPEEEFKKGDEPMAAWPAGKKGKTGKTPDKKTDLKPTFPGEYKI